MKRLIFLIIITFLFSIIQSTSVIGESAPYLRGSTFIIGIRINDPQYKWGTYLLVFDLKSTIDEKITAAESYLMKNAPANAKLKFSHGYYDVTLNYVPDYLRSLNWMEDSIKNIGFSDTDKDGTVVDELTNYIKSSKNVDNVIVLFLPAVGPQGNILGYALGTGDDAERAVVFAYESENINAMPSEIFIHEFLHLFGALDEYYGHPYGKISHLAKEPMKTYYPNYEVIEHSQTTARNIMQAGDELKTWNDWLDGLFKFFNIKNPLEAGISFWSQGQIGWLDFDMDGVPDSSDGIDIQFVNHAPVRKVGISKSDNLIPITRKISFRDTQAVAYSEWEDLNVGDKITVKFLRPDGQTLSSSDNLLSSSGIVSFKSKINIAGTEASKNPGQWKVAGYYNDRVIYYDSFRITAPRIDLSPLSKDFGVIYKSQDPTLDIRIKNTGDEPLTVSKISSENLPIESTIILPTSLLVEINASTISKVKIATIQFGPFKGNVIFESDDPTAPIKKVELSGIIKELIKLVIETLDKHIEVDEPVEFIITGDGKLITNVDVKFDSKTFNTGNANKITITFDLPGKYTLVATKENTTTTDYQSGYLAVEVFKKIITQQLSVALKKFEYKIGERTDIQVLADGQPVQAFIKYDNVTQQTDINGKLSLRFEESKNVTLTTFKDKVETDKAIISYNETSTTIQILQSTSPFENINITINNWIRIFFDFFAKVF